MKNKLLALLAAFGLVATVHAVEINDNISINGFIDGAWTNTDDNGANNDDNDLDIDEVELNFIVNAGSVSGEIHIDDNDSGGNLGNIEQAHFTYSMDNGLSITFGRFGSGLGFEGQDPAGLYTFSRAYDDGSSMFNLGNIDGGSGQNVEGLSLGYSADAFSAALSAVNAVDQAEEGTGFENDLDVEIALTYTGIENLVLGGGMHAQRNQAANTDVDITNVHAAYTMDKLMLGGEYVNIDNEAVTADLSAYLILADYDINDKMGIAVRYSEWETGANAESDRITIAPNYAITDSLGAILEYSSAEDNTGNEEDTLALELTFTF